MKLTPVENHAGTWFKREDKHRLSNGCNGAKLRACQYLIGAAKDAGYERVVSASSVLSPQHAMGASVAADLDMPVTLIVGGTTPEKAARHHSVQVGILEGANVEAIQVGYNPALQSAARKWAAAHPGTYHLQYGITTPVDASEDTIRAFHETSAGQVDNVPEGVETLVLPFGSGNTGTGVLWGLIRNPPPALKRVVLVVIGPDRQTWMHERLSLLGVKLRDAPFEIEVHDLHGSGYAAYGDKMPEVRDGIVFHPTYEGKVVRYMNQLRRPWWVARDDKTLLWIVGGPLTVVA